MTKIKNTKKGMAKKTLSISLAVAMLATSNVPVWAAEDLFTDGEVAVEAFTAEEAFSDETALAEEAPVVEEAEAPEARENLGTDKDVNTANYTVKDLKLEVGAWDTEVTVKGSVKSGTADVTGLSYTWMVTEKDGSTHEAAGNNASSTLTKTQTVTAITYTPTLDDFGKTLSLRIYEKGSTVGSDTPTTIFSQTISDASYVVKAKDISDQLFTKKLNFGTNAKPVYNGKAQYPEVTNTYKYLIGTDADGKQLYITEDNIDWHYEVEGNNFTDVTDKNIVVFGTLLDADVRGSVTYGYTARTPKDYENTYKIWQLELTKDNLKPSLTTTSFEYAGVARNFGKADVKLEVLVNNDGTRVDITDALEADAQFGNTKIDAGTGYKYSSKVWDDNIDFENAIMKNFKKPTADVDGIYAENTYDIVKRNLDNCTGEITQEYMLSSFTKLTAAQLNNVEEILKIVKPADIELTGSDGFRFNLASMKTKGDIAIQFNAPFFEAIKNKTLGSIEGAVTVTYGTNKDNVEGSITLPITLVSRKLGTVSVKNAKGDETITLPTTAAGINTSTQVPYIGKAYDLQATAGALHGLTVSGTNADEYDVSYSDNVNAGVVTVTITGKKSFEGSTKKVYFKITPDVTTAAEFTTKTSVTVNPANNQDASLYKEAIAAKYETALANGAKAVLEEGKDYTVEYFYTTGNGHKTLAQVKADKGTNIPGNYVYAVATTVKNGNFTDNGRFVASPVKISRKSISNVTVEVESPSYTFTGKEIRANVTVKDGSVVLEKGVDYTLKFKDNIEVGTATVTIVPTATSDYDTDTTATATFEITPAKAEDVKVTLGATASATAVANKTNTFNYTGRQVKPSVTKVELNGVDVTKYFDVTYPEYGENVNAGKEAGSVTIAPKANDKNFTGTKTQLFNIQGRKLDGDLKLYYGNKQTVNVDADGYALKYGTTTNERYSFFYDGTEQTFADENFVPGVLYDVKEGTDYEIKYINNKNAGTAFVVVVAKGNYEGSLTNKTFDNYTVTDGQLILGTTVIESNIVAIIAFNIMPTYVTAKNIKVENGTYAGGKPVKPVVSVVVNGKTLVEGEDYTLSLRAIDGVSTPDKFVNVTADEPYYVAVQPMGGYRFDDVNGTNTWTWGIDKKDLADCAVTVTKNGEELELKVMNGNVVELKEAFDVVDNGDGTATVSVVDGGKNYTGSQTVTIIDPTDKGAVGMVSIKDVKVVGNKATVILDGPAENAEGYDYVIATEDDYVNGRVDITKNQLKTTGDFFYVQNGTYYAYCHAYRHDEETGKKVFSPEFSERFKFSVTATTPDTPVITDVVRKGSTVTVTYNTADNAAGYDIVLGTASRKVNGEKRPVEYGTLVKKNQTKTTVTFTNVPAGTYYVGMHAYNRTSADGKKVFSPWANWSKKVTVK